MAHSNTAATLTQTKKRAAKTQKPGGGAAFVRRLFLLPLLCLSCVLVFARAAGDGDDGAALLRAFWSQTPSAQLQFRQRVYDEDGELLSDGGGRLSFARGGKFRVEYQSPEELLLVSDGESFWSYEKDLRQVVVRPLSSLGGGFLVALTAGEWEELRRLYVLSPGGEDGGMRRVMAQSKNPEDAVRSILFGFDKGGALRQLKMRDAFGGMVLVDIGDIKDLPPGAADAVFTFAPPPDAEVISDR